MSTENVIMIRLGSDHDCRAMCSVLHQLVDALGNSKVLSGDVTMYGGMNIKDKKVTKTLNDLTALMEANHANQEEDKKVTVIEGNVIHADFGGNDDDDVVRDLPDLMPAPDTVQ